MIKRPSRLHTYMTLIFVAATIIFVYFMPSDSKNKFSYELNRPWSYDLLTAPFDIPVYRDSATVRMMIDSINRDFTPIYRFDDSAQAKVEATIRADKTLSAPTRQRLLSTIDRLYDSGIIDASTAASIAGHDLQELKFNIDNVTVGIATSDFLSQRNAYAHIDSLFAGNPERGKIQALDLANHLTPNVVEDRKATDQYHESLIQPVVAAIGVIQQGERIIDRGDRVSPEVYQVLKSFEMALDKMGTQDRNQRVYSILGQSVFVITLLLMVWFYFNLYYRNYLEGLTRILMILTAMAVFFIFTALMYRVSVSWIYIVPLAIVPIVVQVFFDARTAFFIYVVEVLLCSVFSSFQLEYIFLQILAGTVVIFSLKELSKRSQLLRSALFGYLSYVVGYLAVEMMSSGSLTAMSWKYIGFFAINAVLISFAYLMIFIIEKLFGMSSVVTLVELADINNPLLRALSTECPGTFQHSMAVSNLASEAAHKIGANVQLVRAGALYHDIGKIENPAFFTENQFGFNPHDTLSPLQSARIIVGHVTDGVKRADKAKLPSVIKDFILQHHGKGLARYFYIKEEQEHPGEEIDPAPFTYPGPNPQTREASLLMMADTVEAASRSLTDHSEKAIRKLVDNLIDRQVSEGYHNDSPLSFRDITTIKETFIKRLRSMYHGRISYPPETKKA